MTKPKPKSTHEFEAFTVFLGEFGKKCPKSQTLGNDSQNFRDHLYVPPSENYVRLTVPGKLTPSRKRNGHLPIHAFHFQDVQAVSFTGEL